MGQDSSCGICGKHYQTCKHRVVEHISNGAMGVGLCGGGGLYVEFASHTDPDDVCKRCRSSLTKLIKTDFAQFLYVMSENQ